MKVALIMTDNRAAWKFRRGLIQSVVQRGFDTYLLAPSGPYNQQLKMLGVKHLPVPVDRFINFSMDVNFTRTLYKIFRAEKFEIVHNVSLKPNIYGAIAARLASVPTVIGSVTGLGTVFMDEMGLRIRLLRPLVSLLYRFAFSLTDRVWFQNQNDADFFVSSLMISKKKVVLIRSSGVNLNDFSTDAIDVKRKEQLRRSLGIEDSAIIISMVARTLWYKGTEEFIKASQIISATHPCVKFLLIGDGEKGNPQSIPREYLESKQFAHLSWLGWRDDVKDILSITDVAVLLSREREGVPKSLLEAMAMSKPIVTTNVPGCKEVVEDGRNGYLVPPKKAENVAEALKKLIIDPSLRSSFGAYSRRKVEIEFDQDLVNKRVLDELYAVG